MKITKIELYNFGSYEGYGSFDLSADDPSKRIVIIGGKNGAGKTTLFTAIQVCLYGNYAFGYKTAGAFYKREIGKLINSTAHLKQNEAAHVTIEFQHTNARERTNYVITREWKWVSGEIEETLNVRQNGQLMDEDDLESFQKFLIHLIPPDMLKLYFFDGEKIADYFLSDNQINIREALMILSGNDTFDILHDNVRRVLNLNKDSDTTEYSSLYFQARDEHDKAREEAATLESNRDKLLSDLANEEARLELMKTQYSENGGITLEELNKLQMGLKTEEDRREKINSQRKTIATDILPFVILKDLVLKVQPQIQREENFTTYKLLESKLSDDTFRMTLSKTLKANGIESDESINNILESISENLLTEDWTDFIPLFQLSSDEELRAHSIIDKTVNYDQETLKNYQEQLDESLAKTKQIRSKIQNSDAEHIEDYIRQTTEIEGEIKLLNSKIEQADEDISRSQEELHDREKLLGNARKNFENSLKKDSVSSLSGRLLLMLEELQSTVYSGLIKKVESDLNNKMKQLMRKGDFFDDVQIDSDFNVHILKNQTVLVRDLIQIVKTGGQTALKEYIGPVAYNGLVEGNKEISSGALITQLNNLNELEIELPLEIKKENMSSGEKQIFVMSLYWALMKQSDNELPFVIDTPFARIDTEHRKNITRHFFMELKGQLFILSTNEELEQEHLEDMKDEIAHVFTLEYGEEKRTIIKENTYFGE